MKNAKDPDISPFTRILNVGRTGSGKTTQIWTLPGKKFAYIFDPNSMKSLKGLDIDYQEFYPDLLELDATLKGFNKGAKDDTLASKREPTVYLDWVDDINEKAEEKFFEKYDWLCFDSMTFLAKATMNRQLFINGRYGSIEDLGDYRIVGSKLTEVFNSITGLPMNIYATGHIDTFQDEKTKKIETLIKLPGSARNMLPLMFTEIWKSQVGEDQDGNRIFEIITMPEPRGLQDIRTSIPGLEAVEDVTIRDFNHPTDYGIGALLKRNQPVDTKGKVIPLANKRRK